ncbi:hypothetical protein [Hamadaea tsunoensis]|uniref:hypothetical protein n=1 Tax=Hamadaea tsunoensis TaxID=53368 RepID=UPI00041B4EA2|nr:hypothetical protein [Hamadaea tsunoensis]
MGDDFLTRLLRLDPASLVRTRPAGPDAVAWWSMLPWGVLATRTVAGSVSADRTVSAADLAGGTARPANRDGDWRWALPPATSDAVEVLPAAVVRDIAAAAARTLREAMESGVDGRPVGSRALRDALLDHVAVTVQVDRPGPHEGRNVPVSLRLVQALTRTGLLEGAESVEVRVAGPWTGLATGEGAVWYRASAPTLRPL